MVEVPSFKERVALDPITYQVIFHRLSGIVREMQQVIHRTGFSTIIRESYDTSCAILTPDGKVAGQHVILPLHMGAFPACIQGILRHYPVGQIYEGDAFVLNHPYEGGSPHAMDMAVVTPVFYGGRLVAFCANMAHKSDIGGMVPGSAAGNATEIFQEGLHVPPVQFMNNFKIVPEVEAILRCNSRTPDLILGDLHGQVGTNRIGEKRVQALLDKYGEDLFLAVLQELFERTERRVRGILAQWPDGTVEEEGFIESDGIDLDHPVGIRVRVEKQGEKLRFDFQGSDDQTRGPANIRPPLVRSCCHYAFLAVSDPEIPNNDGLAQALQIDTRRGSILDPKFPGSLTSYASTAQIVMEICIAALCRLSGRQGIAESGGGLAIALGGTRSRTGSAYVQYEILGSALGARSRKDGVSGITVHLANCKVTPVEILETEFPVRVLCFEFVTDSGGAGRYRGGLGFRREYEILSEEARFTLRGDKFVLSARGRAGGMPGRSGRCLIVRKDGSSEKLPSKVSDLNVYQGDRLLLERPGAGGYGPPAARPATAVLEDVLEGSVSLPQARDIYRVAIDASTMKIDERSTQSLRSLR